MVTRKTILVTGANGQLGSELRRLAAAYPFYKFIFVTREDLAITDLDAVKEYFHNAPPSFCINCAAYTAVDKAETETGQAYSVNSEATGNLAAVSAMYNTRFIHISTDYVFDGTASSPYTEESATNPVSVYGKSKLEGERKAVQANPGSIIIRTAWVYSQFGKNFVKTMLRLMRDKPEIGVVNDQYGSPTWAADLAEAIMLIIGSGNPVAGIFHFSNQGVINWFDFATAIRDLSHLACRINPLSTTQYPTPAKRPAYSVLDSRKIAATYNIPLRHWKDSLEQCLSAIREQERNG